MYKDDTAFLFDHEAREQEIQDRIKNKDVFLARAEKMCRDLAGDFEKVTKLAQDMEVIPPDHTRTGRNLPGSISHVFINMAGAIHMPLAEGLVKLSLFTVAGAIDRMATLEQSFAKELAALNLHEKPTDLLFVIGQKIQVYLPEAEGPSI